MEKLRCTSPVANGASFLATVLSVLLMLQY